MKRIISLLLAAVLICGVVLTGSPDASGAAKANQSRAIAIVFDNSGSMYDNGDKAWCRATYAMEVFASMLNAGDVLQIYPMHPIRVGEQQYTMNEPLQLTDASQAPMIREIFSIRAGGTPIESIDCAAEGIRNVKADKKYLIVLTDGGIFSLQGRDLTRSRTTEELDKRVQANAGEDLTVMYLGIDKNSSMPKTEESLYFFKQQAANSADVLSTLTVMCNRIFGRDTLPKNRINGNTIEFDISMSKLIVFVQGEDIADLKLTGGTAGQPARVQQTKYSTLGTASDRSVPDTSLQGMMVTYTDCLAGKYTIEYTGTASSVEIYYEPDADLDFVFTDSSGRTVDADAIFGGNYKVSFGLKDAQTGKLIESDLLGNPHYEGSYSINGQAVPIVHDGYSGEVPVSLKKDDIFAANLTVTYLSGYTITKDSSDFGWPEGGIQVAAMTPGNLILEITGGQEEYVLLDLEEGEPYIAKVYYDGVQLTGDELEKVDLKWLPETSNAEIKKEFAGDHYNLYMHYKNPGDPQGTACGECTVDIHAYYSAKNRSESHGQTPLTYKIRDDGSVLKMSLFAPEDYILISDLDDSQEIVVTLLFNGEPMAPEDLEKVDLKVDTGGIRNKVIVNPEDSSFSIKLQATDRVGEGDYPIQVTAVYFDNVGRENRAEDSVEVTLSHIPLWMRWTIGIVLLVALLIVLWIVLHIRVLPVKLNTTRKLSSMNFDGDDVSQSTNFQAELRKKSVKVQSQYAGKKFGVSMDVTPGKESYLYKPQKRRSAMAKVASVKKFGPAKIQEVMIGSAKFVADDTSGKLVPALPNQKPFPLTNGMMVKYSGTIQDAGVDKDFEVTSKLNFNKK